MSARGLLRRIIPPPIRNWVKQTVIGSENHGTLIPQSSTADVALRLEALENQLRAISEQRQPTAVPRPTIYLGRNRILTRTIFGQNIVLDSLDKDVCLHVALDGFWEPWITDVMTRLIREGMTVIDIGAHVGYYTLLACSRVGPSGNVIAFEPDPLSFDALTTGVRINGYSDRCVCVNKAVSAGRGQQRFFRYEAHSGGNTLWGQETRAYDNVQTIEVTTISLDEFVAPSESRSGKVDIVKIDAEGSEGLILNGMDDILRKNRDIIVICEFCPKRLLDASSDPAATLDVIEHHGFELRYVEHDSNLKAITREELLALGEKDLMLYLSRK